MLKFFLKPLLIVCFTVMLCTTLLLSVMSAHSQNIDTALSVSAKPLIAQSLSSSSSQKQQQLLVTIDPGHGGKDPGYVGAGSVRESDVNLAIATKVTQLLQQKGITANITRNNDSFVSLENRVNIAQQNKSRIFVSIHANSSTDHPDYSGIETYHADPNSELLATTVHRTVLANFGSNNASSLNDRGVKTSSFVVLRKSKIPAILLETGFLTNSAESSWLADQAYQNQMAEGISQGIAQYLTPKAP
jgi:N-acetylmuramoyl-L-alanine amidase